MFTIKSDHGLSEVGYNRIVEWMRSILPEENKLKENFHAAKSMMKPFVLGYQKIDLCLKFCMLYYIENTELTECETCEHSHYKPITGKGRTFFAHRKLRYFSIASRLLSIWHDTNHMMRWMKWWCTLPLVKPRNTLTMCILSF